MTISNNKILNLENIKNMTIDEIVILYREGYKLEENEHKSLTQATETSTNLILGGIVGLVIGMIVYNIAISKAKLEIKKKCPGCYEKLYII
jgi:F0F1-type ATP synthase assembly protein I